MEKCKFCPEMLEEGSTVCPGCGRDNAQEEAPVQELTAEETAVTEAAVPAEEAAIAEEPAVQEAPQEEKKATPGKLAMVIAAIVVVAAVIVGLLMSGIQSQTPAVEETTPAAAESTEPAATVPADGNPDDETCKGTYTVTDEEVKANAAVVVATVGERELTNAQLQPFYWMQVQSFLSSDYGQYMMYYGVLDYTQPLDTQICAMTGTGTWQQFFLAEALNTWHSYCALADKASQAGMELTEEEQTTLDTLEETLEANAAYYGLSVEELMAKNMGAGASVADYAAFQELLIRGNKFYDAETAGMNPTIEEVEAFFAEHEREYADSGITREGKLVDVRHVLFVPEGGTTDENGSTTYSEEEWAECEARAQDALNAWMKGEATEATFADMATAMTQDPGSMSTGGLYEDVQQGQMVEAFDAWCFDEKREPGHNGIVQTNYGYHLMYFVGSTPIWESYARQDYVAQLTTEMMDKLTAEYPMTVDYSAITLGYVDMAG